ncbi:MAG: hypothetical protein VXX42_13920 [SAR324 cluster bacterium]|nr:hypothetical protein [SAR324 cluster bacterium]
MIGKHWTPARAAQERGRRIDGEPSNREKRQSDEAERIARLHRPNLENLFNRYLADKADERGRPLKSENKLQKTFEKHFKQIKDKTPDELAETDVLRIRRDILKNWKTQNRFKRDRNFKHHYQAWHKASGLRTN